MIPFRFNVNQQRSSHDKSNPRDITADQFHIDIGNSVAHQRLYLLLVPPSARSTICKNWRVRIIMPRGDKSKYTDKQRRKAEHIEEGYERRGVPQKEAERRAWATVNKETGGGKKGGSGRGISENRAPSRKGGRRGGRAAARRPAAARSASAKKGAATRKARGH
jgi:plasmid stabilization system protein ParE